MSETTTLARIMVALLFAISFTLIGWTAPVLYATHAPDETFIEVHDFEAQNVNPQSDTHYICFDRTMSRSTSGTVYTELYLIDGNGNRVEVGGERLERYFQEGRHSVVTPMDLPDNLKPGEYRYLLIIQMDLADGRIERDFAYRSEPFQIGPEYDTNPSRDNFSCAGG